MKNLSLLIGWLIAVSCSSTQQLLAPMPLAVSNNAVANVTIDGKDYIYSFGGIDNSKIYSGISLRSFRYSVNDNMWEEIDPLPDTMPKIAAAASVVKGKVYIIGGYYVFPDGHEKSSYKVHVFDPVRNEFLVDAEDLLTPIDDQVQAVWNDSLIYVASGWSDSLNVNLVQVYKPGGHWHYATSMPDEPGFKVFGSSGIIIGDNLYFAGGAGNGREARFPVQPSVKVGHINPSNPLEITWEIYKDSLANVYRPAAVNIDDNPYWIGGAPKSYNYNGIAYTGEAVSPRNNPIYFTSDNEILVDIDKYIPQIMDLRGAAELSDGRLAIVGGMSINQEVSNQVWIFKP